MLSLAVQVVEDMVLWWEFNIVIGKHSVARISCSHPCDQNCKFHFMADTARSLNNLRNHLTHGHSIFLPADMVENHKIFSNEANLEPIQKLVEIDSQVEVKHGTTLKPSLLDSEHHEKNESGVQVFPRWTMTLQLHYGSLCKEEMCSKWLWLQPGLKKRSVETVHRWFKVWTSWTTKLTKTKLSDQKYQHTVTHVVTLLEDLKIGSASSCQTALEACVDWDHFRVQSCFATARLLS